MSYKRRDFIKTTAAGLAITAVTGKLLGCNSSSQLGDAGILKEFGLQLYTLRDVLPQDPKGVLKQVAAMGYKQIESYEGNKGMFWGMTNTEFKKYMDDLGMKIVSSHCNFNADFERKANEAAAIGMKYLIAPYLGPQKSIDVFKNYANQFNQLGEVCKKAGLRFAYHNHDYSFKAVDGQIPQDVMMQNTDASLVDFEMDIYWVVTAGEDPIKWFEKYPNRFRLSHIKDRKKNVPLSDTDASCIVGQGQIDFAKILKSGLKNGLKYNIVEQERYDNTTPLMAAKADAEYLKKLKI
ncbi:MAG TPA: sugar phosphate isomerase/epimerase [Chitinophagaceae bacterium]|nr:sugar phosphate isomerase/epimerase [Chitinophagaceae bacterium]